MKIADLKSNLLDMARCYSCSVRESALCSGLSDEEFCRLNPMIEDMQIASGDTLFRQGNEGKYVYTLRQGMIKLVRIRQNGDQRIMRILRPGDVGGLEVLVASQYEYDAIALDRALLCRIPVKTLQQLDSESPKLHQKLLERWYQTVSEADEWMAELTSGSARARMARLLLKMRNPEHQELSTLFSREDIGSMLCMTMETASRTINAFQREGKISPLDATGRLYRIEGSALADTILDSD